MSAPDTPTPLLIQQRMALQRATAFAIAQIVVALLLATFWAATLLDDPTQLWRMLPLIGFVVAAVAGVVSLRRARRNTRAFDQQHGKDAGRR